MSDLTKCNQKPACANPPAYRFTWAGRDEVAICEEHAKRLHQIAEAMGYYCQLIPLPLREDERVEVCDECGAVGPVYLCGASVRCHRCAGLYEETNHEAR